MNRRSNKILRELILGNRQNILELVTKYNLQDEWIKRWQSDIHRTEIVAQSQILWDFRFLS